MGRSDPAPRAEDSSVGDLFREYRTRPDPELHAALTARFMPLVHQLARRYSRSGIPIDDLSQIGYIGLMSAIVHFDPDRGVKFETYARHLIAGEIRHYLRDQGTTVRRPRWLYELDHRVTRSVAELNQRLGRPPTTAEIANDVSVMEDEVLEVLRARESLRFVSLDEEREGDDGVPMAQRDRIGTKDVASVHLPIEDRILIGDAIERLSGLQRKVIYYLFYMDLTQTEAAMKLGISQKHVSRVMHTAIKRLRETLQAEAI